MKIALGSDHAGFELKEIIKKELEAMKIECRDFGPHSEESVDYTDFASAVCGSIQKKEHDRGILICGTGIGMSIAANKHKGILASLVDNTFSAEMTRRHNNSNVLVLPGRLIGKDLAKAILKKWIETPYEGGRHDRRLEKIREIEQNQ